MYKSIVKQEPSHYFLKDGRHCVEYKFKVSHPYYLSDIKVLWVATLGTDVVNLSPDQKEATYYKYSNDRAVKWSQEELDLIFSDLVVIGFPVPNKTPDKFKVNPY